GPGRHRPRHGRRHPGAVMVGPGGPRVAVLLAGAGARWEAAALAALDASAGVVVHKRCVDLPDLLAVAGTGRGDVALVDGELAGLDAAALHHLRKAGLGVLVCAGDPGTAERARNLGAAGVVGPDQDDWPRAVRDAVPAAPAPVEPPDPGAPTPELPEAHRAGEVVVVWGPGGAPGRTTVAVGVAAAAAAPGRASVLLDADPAGGTVAQHLGLLDEVSGVLAAARLGNQGRLDEDRMAACLRTVSPRRGGAVEVLTGFPRPDRWSDLRPGALPDLVGLLRRRGPVVLDAGAGWAAEPDPGLPGRRTREDLVRESVEVADKLVVVGTADPVGLTRLSRCLVGLVEQLPDALERTHVVVNRMRGSLGWGEREIRGMVEGLGRPASTSFLPEEQQVVDRALVHGTTLAEAGAGPLHEGMVALATGLGLVAVGGARRSIPVRGRRRR
ncbi:MAG: hypothetical protein Q8Q02_15660, partial [Nocardioides sp.]|nr:hypothetical protein [Nocardioides sp.]